MCELCLPRITRRRALALAGGAAAASLVAGGWGSANVRAQSGVVTPSGLTIMPRATWAGEGRDAVGPLESEDVRFLLVHHTASANGAEPIGVMRGAYNFHTGPDKGWPDVAYNFFIDQNGVVYEGRTGSLAGSVAASATGGSQGFAQLVCLLGDFTSQNPSPAALESLNLTLAWLADRYGVDTGPGATVTFTSRGSNRWPAGQSVTADTISGHREMSQTACPGDTFFPYLKADVRAQVDALRTGAPASDPGGVAEAPATTQGPPTTASAPSTTSTAPATSTTSTSPSTSTVAPPSTFAPDPTTTTRPTSSAPVTAADGPVGSAPAPAAASDQTPVDELGAPAAEPGGAPGVATSDGGGSNALALGVAAGAVVLAGGAAAYVGLRGRHDAADDERLG